jgi:hypothetical protein
MILQTAWAIHDSADCSAEVIHADQEAGQLCHEVGDDSFWIADAGGGTWTQVHGGNTLANPIHVPQNAIILWDQATGDEACVGGAVAGDCPCGYVKADEFDGLTIRGADEAAGDANIPDTPAEDCEGDGSGNDPPCVTQAGRYSDTITTVQMPGHTHNVPNSPNDAGNEDALDGGQFASINRQVPTSSTGDDDPHYHPFRTVLFCRKS